MTVVASRYARKENDLYQTEPWATEAYLRRFPVNGLRIWECAAGNHLIADVLREHGASVHTSDIMIYDRPHDELFNFLTPTDNSAFSEFDGIITNPPYGIQNRTAVKFVETALARCAGIVAMLLTAKFNSGSTRTHLFRDSRRFAAKIVLLDRISFELNDVTGTEDHAWYIWGPRQLIRSHPVIFHEGKVDK